MAWVLLVVAGMLEAVWASALGASQNFTKKGPTALFVVALVLSMVGLALAMGDLPVGTAYAVWVGIGAVLTVVVAVVRGQEVLTVARALLLAVLIGCVVGLKVVS
ncbi:DMT family transporter [Frigoribacterium faeni]|jgi:quaternary ammonium compound-resistance protein SugE|uniref:DMT family transporter n=1 Tax=Frigoribacterium faeni TaxID=145483 RepID=UPI00141BE6B4|nr:SMR family transporter [Frigoribacterium faeni]NIJ06309.1 quaternary ammonium compound-resistance protein SugE [Frigoribacterium faeni]